MFSVQISVTICQHTFICVRTLIYFKYMIFILALLINLLFAIYCLMFDIQLYFIVNYIKLLLRI